MITVISRFRVRNGLEEKVREAFLNRPRLVENASGFCGLEVLTDSVDPSVFLLLTRWTDEQSFRTWHHSEAHHESHSFMPRGLKLDAAFTSLTVGTAIEDPAGSRNLSDVLEGRTAAISRWLMESDSVSALLLASDGTIRARNPAADRIFADDPAKSTIWDYLASPGAEDLRQCLSGPLGPGNTCLRLRLTGEMQNPAAFEAGLVSCGAATLLLAVREPADR